MTTANANPPPRFSTPPFAWLLIYQRLAGICDAFTGLLLLFLPYQTLHLMKFQNPEGFASPQGVSMVGAFVLSTGLAYLATARRPTLAVHMAYIEATMLITAMTRAIVAVYLISRIVRGDMEWPWFTVATTDGFMALLQAGGLKKGWWQWKETHA